MPFFTLGYARSLRFQLRDHAFAWSEFWAPAQNFVARETPLSRFLGASFRAYEISAEERESLFGPKAK